MKTLAQRLFEIRSYTPIPFLIVMLIFAQPTVYSLIIGIIIAVIGELFRLWGVVYAGSETRTTGSVGGTYLVVSGAFAYLRNPLYLGNILLYTGVGVMSMALFPYLQIAALLFFYFQYRMIISEEEKYLSKTFGEAYETYKKNVPRLIPSFKKFKNPGVEQPRLNISAGLKSEKRSLQAFTLITIIMIVILVAEKI
ncbi:MAG: isoprenylcysteine carboxylmethyltransferase family protein [Ignavibacteria bacterium]|nr:MAG: isoprenylcysteine carboxylmethyltransferase family protein [Ignavibacteria bacterium]